MYHFDSLTLPCRLSRSTNLTACKGQSCRVLLGYHLKPPCHGPVIKEDIAMLSATSQLPHYRRKKGFTIAVNRLSRCTHLLLGSTSLLLGARGSLCKDLSQTKSCSETDFYSVYGSLQAHNFIEIPLARKLRQAIGDRASVWLQ